jgi:uncharacterized protein
MREKWISDAIEQTATTKQESSAYLRSLKTMPRDQVWESLKPIHKEVFDRIDCLACAQCCKTTPALVTPQDAARIAGNLGLSTKAFVQRYLIEDINGEYIINGVPCTFLNDDNTCQIYDFRPEACRRYPHTDERDYSLRHKLNLANALMCPAAAIILFRLQETLPITS